MIIVKTTSVLVLIAGARPEESRTARNLSKQTGLGKRNDFARPLPSSMEKCSIFRMEGKPAHRSAGWLARQQVSDPAVVVIEFDRRSRWPPGQYGSAVDGCLWQCDKSAVTHVDVCINREVDTNFASITMFVYSTMPECRRSLFETQRGYRSQLGLCN